MTEWANYLKILKINILILEIKEETIQGGIILKEVGYLPCRHQDNKYKSDTLKHYMYYVKLWKLFLIVNYITESQLLFILNTTTRWWLIMTTYVGCHFTMISHKSKIPGIVNILWCIYFMLGQPQYCPHFFSGFHHTTHWPVTYALMIFY